MACTDICAAVLNDMLFDCSNVAVGGIEQTVKVVNRCDIDLSEWTVDNTATPAGCTHSIAYTGIDPTTMNAIKVQGIPGKQLLNYDVSWADTDFGIRYTHLVNLFSQGVTAETICNLKALGLGAEVVVFIEQKNKGTNNESAFWVFGWYTGLKLADGNINSSENNGNAILPLTSREPDLEPYPQLRLFMTDYATTKTFFDSL